MAGIKSESGYATAIKNEGDVTMTSPGAASDVYEDIQGDLDFSHFSPDIFLARLPKYLWKSWETLGDNDEIEIGTMRVEGPIEKPVSMSLKLHPTIPSHQNVPKEFILRVTNEKPSNTFIFSEEDLPGFNSRLKMTGRAGDDTNLPMSKAIPQGMRQARPKTDNSKVDKTKRFQNFRRAIPKKTALAGRVHTEISCLAVENEDYKRIMAERNAQEHKILPPLVTNSITGDPMAGRNVVDNFIKAAPLKKKTKQDKFVRMAQNEVLDGLGRLFREWTNWRLKDLVERLQQPEQYIKQNLVIIGAHLVQSGSKVGTYALNEAARKILAQEFGEMNAVEDIAPDQGTDDENVKMENT